MKSLRLLPIGFCLTLLLSGCAHTGPERTLYQRLGGEPGIERIVSDFIDRRPPTRAPATRSKAYGSSI